MSRFHMAMAAHERDREVDVEAKMQFEQQYAAAEEGLYNRDREALDVLHGVRSTSLARHHAEEEGQEQGKGGGGAGQDRTRQPAPAPLLRRASAPLPPLGPAAKPGGGNGNGRSGLERPSTTASAITGSTSDEPDIVLETVVPEDGGPLRRFVTRSSSFTKDDFEKLLSHTGLFHVDMAGSTDRRLLRSHLPPSKIDPPSPTSSNRRRQRQKKRKGGSGSKHRSVFGLPMLRPDSSAYMAWSSVALLSDLTYSAFVVPISIGMWTSFYVFNWTTICDFLFGAIFLADMFVSLHVGFIATCDTRKLLVMNGRLVARNYLLSFNFLLDGLSCLAWLLQIALIVAWHTVETFNPDTALVVMEGIRLMRFLRVYRLVMSLLRNGMYATLVVESPYFKWLRGQTFLSMLYLLYIIAVVINFLGCLYNFTAGAQGWDGTWVNFYEPFIRRYSSDGPNGYLPLTAEEAADIDRVWLYFTGCYWALSTIATVGFGDIVPQNEAETLVVIFVELCGVLFFGLLISSISELLAHANRAARRTQAYRNKMQSVERWMSSNMLPAKLQRRIKTFYAEVWVRQHEVKEETVLFQELPHALRNEVAWQACKGMFGKLPLLRELDDKTLYLLASKMTPFRFAPGHDLVTEGDPADRFWILPEGEVIALYQYHEAERLVGPAVIGESVLLQEHEPALRSFPCTYRTLTSCTCWMVRCRDFKPMLSTRPGLQEMVKARALQSLSEHMQRYPSMWADKGLKHLHSPIRRNLGRAPSDRGSPQRQLGHGEDSPSVGGGGGGAGGAGLLPAASGAAAARSRLARASAPAVIDDAPPGARRHVKSVSWAAGSEGVADGGGGGGDGWGLGCRDWNEAADAAIAEAQVGPSMQQQQRQQEQQQRLPFAAASAGAGTVAAAASAAAAAAACPAAVEAVGEQEVDQPTPPPQQQQQQQPVQWRPPLPAGRSGSGLRQGLRHGGPQLPSLPEHAQPALPSGLRGTLADDGSWQQQQQQQGLARGGRAPPSVSDESPGASVGAEVQPGELEQGPGAAGAPDAQRGQQPAGAADGEALWGVLTGGRAAAAHAAAGVRPRLALASTEAAGGEAGKEAAAALQEGQGQEQAVQEEAAASEAPSHSGLAAGAAALAAAAAVLPGHLLVRGALTARQEQHDLSQRDAEYEAEIARLATGDWPPEAAPAHDRFDAAGGAGGDRGGPSGEEDGGGGMTEEGSWPPMERLTTAQALRLLARATQARQEEEAAMAEVQQSNAAAMLAGLGGRSAGGGGIGTAGGVGAVGSGGGTGAAAGPAADVAGLLSTVLQEVLALRQAVDRMRECQR